MSAEKIKMYCICSKEALGLMKGIRGKMITQGGHAYLHAFWDAEKRFPKMAQAYKDSERAFKITLAVATTEELAALEEAYRPHCGVSLVTDAGLTVFDGPTTTFLGIGPIPENMIGDDLRSLKLLA